MGWDVPFPSPTEKDGEANCNRWQSPIRLAPKNGGLDNRVNKQEKDARRSEVQEILRLYQMLQAMRMCHDRSVNLFLMLVTDIDMDRHTGSCVCLGCPPSCVQADAACCQ